MGRILVSAVGWLLLGGVIGYGVKELPVARIPTQESSGLTSAHQAKSVARALAVKTVRSESPSVGSVTQTGVETAVMSEYGAQIAAILKLPSEFEQYLATYRLVENNDEATLRELLAITTALEDEHASLGLSQIVLSRYALLNPVDGLRYLLQTHHTKLLQRRLLVDFYHQWSLLDLQGALAHLAMIDDGPLRNSVLLFVLRDSVHRGRPELAAFVATLPPLLQQQATVALAMSDDPTTAFQQLLALTIMHPGRHQGLFNTLSRWAYSDPQAAISEAIEQGTVHQQQQWIPAILATWSTMDPEAAWEAALEQDNGSGTYLSAVLMEVAKHNGHRALALAREQPGRVNNSMLNNLLRQWAGRDPRGAAQYWESQTDGFDPRAIRIVAAAYVRQHPEEALRWVGDYDVNQTVYDDMVRIFADSYPQQAERYLETSAPGNIRQLLINSLAWQKASHNGEAAYQWLSRFSDEPGYQQAQRSVIVEWIRQDPVAASQMLLHNGKLEREPGYVNILVNYWGRQDPDYLESWVFELPPGTVRDQALKIMIGQLANSDPNKAKRLLTDIADQHMQFTIAQQLQRQEANN